MISSQEPRPSLRERLRGETRREHEQLEQQLDLVRPDLTIAQYRETLERFYGFYAGWEPQAAPLLELFQPGFYEPRRKLPLLLSDLRALGSDPVALPVCTDLPHLAPGASVVGSAYVIEGSTLGGQIISRHLAQTLHLSGDGTRFFQSYGELTGTRWRAFLALVEGIALPAEQDAAVASASATFHAVARWMAFAGANE